MEFYIVIAPHNRLAQTILFVSEAKISRGVNELLGINIVHTLRTWGRANRGEAIRGWRNRQVITRPALVGKQPAAGALRRACTTIVARIDRFGRENERAIRNTCVLIAESCMYVVRTRLCYVLWQIATYVHIRLLIESSAAGARKRRLFGI